MDVGVPPDVIGWDTGNEKGGVFDFWCKASLNVNGI